MIESEFALLARKDFVDFVNQGSQAKNLAPIEAKGSDFNQKPHPPVLENVTMK